jgi:hypothetical protein
LIKNILLILASLSFSAPALAQEYGALLGVHQTSADSDLNGTSVDGVFNFKAGLAVGFELAEFTKFRTGVIYNQRHLESTTAGSKTEIKYDYLDVPALIQYNVNEMFGMFGGLVVGINVNDDLKPKPTSKVDVETLIPLLSVGINLTFQDMIGFDIYYERGMGDISDGLENFSTFGANFLYWF